jgi:hypothetical protein
MLIQIDVVEYLIGKGPGRTELELAIAIHGPNGRQPQVNQDCRMLADRAKIERRGLGGAAEPYRYYPL